MSDARDVVRERLEEVGLAEGRFIEVVEGEKRTYNHDDRWNDPREVPGLNYGVYTLRDESLFILDVDDHDDGTEEDAAALEALEQLPETLTIESPHVNESGYGGHRLFSLTGDEPPAEVFNREFGAENPTASWGEVIAKNKFAVGAGSQLDGCSKEWCDECATDEGGRYEVKHDADVATVDAEDVVEALAADPDLTRRGSETLDHSDLGGGVLDDAEDVGKEYDGPEREWTREEIESMLDALPGDQHFDDWLRTGYAVYDWNDEEDTGKEVFEQWSRTNEDHQGTGVGQQNIDYIWRKGVSGDGSKKASVGTLVYLARKHGWTDGDDDDDDLPVPVAFEVHNGGYAEYHDGDEEDSGWYERVTNFQIELLSLLTRRDGGKEFRLRVHPAVGEAYDVEVEPVVFNDPRKFTKEVLIGETVVFDGSRSELNRLKEFVGSQDAPRRRSTKQIGLHGDEFVTPAGSMTADGWADDPDVVYTDDASQLNPLWSIDGDDSTDVDEEEVADILRLLPQTRDSERFLPVLGWFYAAPFRPLIQEWEGEFNLLNVLGDTGAGKTATLETMWRLFGMDSELLRADSTSFTILTALSSSNSLPVVFDEYKPADMSDYTVKRLHSYLRTSTKGGVESKGNADRTTDNYHLNAPVCLSGEQPIQGPAEERRAIMTTFTREGVIGDTPASRAFSRLNGGKADGTYHEGRDLEQHALAFYQWLLGESRDDLRELWRFAKEDVLDTLDGRGFSAETFDSLVIQGFQTIKFGCLLYRAFAREYGVDPEMTGVTTGAVDDAIEYVASEGGGAEHVSHLDRFVELLGRAAAADYLEDGEHYTFVDDGVNGSSELRVKLPTAFDQVRRYARDHDVRGEDLLDNLNDYRARLRDNAETDRGYVTATSVTTRLSDSTLTRCVAFDTDAATAEIEEFEVSMFGGDSREAADIDAEEPGLSGLNPGRHTVEVTVAEQLEPKPWQQGRGHVVGDDGTILSYVAEGSTDPLADVQEGDRVRIEDAKIGTDRDGVERLEVSGVCEIEPLETRGAEQSAVTDAAADGGLGFETPTGQVEEYIRYNGGPVDVSELASELPLEPDTARKAAESLAEKGRVIERDDGFTLND
jgi:hypothetical protein